ncbi:hypothetical protein VP1G_07378 [Cytospora mali]|uniref:DUF7924 domain-containing protein n=1 Tax=Cytospora mali TaxID=578113 RepID=A0A194V8J0_CYTMA|nr:hypothetical protein VP1G_07378 [Valsa mali var. pyri (nom. inval.)]
MVTHRPVQSNDRKRKQSVEDKLELSSKLNRKRQWQSTARPAEETLGEPATGNSVPEPTGPIAFWVEEGRWPESRSATSITPSDQRPREEKTAPYMNAQYPLLLETKGSYMRKSPLGITDDSKRLCETLLNSDQPTPNGSLFDDDIFESVCDNLANRNEAKIIQDVSRLIVPSAEQYALRRKHLTHLVENINEGWNNSIPLTGACPQPDYFVGFRREAFTEDELTKLIPFVGDFLSGDQSFFIATYFIYFPFLTL